MVTKENILLWLDQKWSESKVDGEFDEEVSNGNWLDPDWADEADSEYEWYTDFGRGEAEDAVRESIEKDIFKHFEITEIQFFEITGKDPKEFLCDRYHTLYTI